ncbi:MAG: methylated-DNA--[protein]-cysteine S-methyltransferase [Xanthobacteraceae bacterium]|nr:methylated-DNA--[protein]-cysteine S-methyltransferase [Xanthobacteraceae bacterium]
MDAQATHHHLFDTAIGECGVAWNARGLCGVQLPEKDRGQTELCLAVKCHSTAAAEVPPWIQSAISDIQRYLAGQPVDFSAIAVDLDGIDGFRKKLYAALREIGFGRTTTYGELAKKLGLTGWEGAREVGEAMGKNPMPVVIPCHRVLAAGGKLGGFSAYGGPATKQKLLALEGVGLDKAPPRLPGL